MEEEPEKNPYENLGKRQNPYEIYKQRKALAEQTNYKGRFWSGDWLPEGYKNVSMQRSSENPNLVYWKPQEIAMHRSLMPPAVFDTTKERQGFWDNPQTVGRFYDFLSVQDDDYVPPDWLDPDNVKALYKELKAFNENEDWFDWKPLPFGSMGSYTAYHMGSPTGESNYPFRTKTDTLYTERLPTVFGNVQNAIDEYNAIQKSVQTKGYLEQKDYESLKNAIQQYNMPLEEIAEIDPELYQELGGTMEMPQFQTMQTTETKQPEIGEMDWSKFPGWMQFMLTLTTTAEYKNRPESSKKIAAAIPAGVQGFMTASMAGMLTGFIASRVTSPIIATPKVKIGLQLGTFALGTVVGVSQYMKAMSGDTSASGIDKVLQLMGIIDEATERVQGMRDILARDITGREEFVSSQPEYGQTYEEWMAKIREELEQDGEPNPDVGKPGYFGAAWKAAQLYYDAGGINTGDWVTDKVSQAGFLLQQIFPEANISEGLTTKDGQIWRLNEGLDTPQNTEYWGTKTLNLVQKDIMALGKNPDKDKVALVLAKWQDRYGYSGSMNNLAGQILISPTNLVPILSDIGIEKIANVKLKTAIKNNDFVGQVKWTQVKASAKWAQGNVVTDMLPMGVQQAFEGSMKLIGTNTALNKLLKIASPESNPIGAFWKGSGTPFHVYSAFKSMEASGYSVGAMQDIAELATSAKIISADGTEIKGKIIEGSDTSYKIMDTTKNWVYELDNTDIVKSITDAEGKAIDVPEGMKAVVDKALYQKAVDFMTKDIIETNSKNLTTMLETKPDAVGGKLGEMTTKLADLTPEAKVSKTARSLAEVILNMNAFSGNNADTFNAMIRYYGGDIDIPKISEAAKQFGLGGLIAETTMAWKEFVNSPDYSARVSLWKEQVEGRVAVNKIAKGINVEAKDMLVMKPADIYAELLKVNPVVAAGTSPDKIEKLLKPFIKGAPLNDAQYISQMTIAVIEATEKFLIKNYDVKEYPALRRFSNLMKTALGSVVITANIPALITNIGTNEVTAALMLGASGWMTPTKQKAFFERIGMPEATKALIGEGFSMSADIRKAQSQLYRALNPKNSWMTKTQNKISEMSKKIPLIGNLYSVVEDYSRAKAFAGAVKQAMSLPLSEMTPMLRDSLKANGFSNQEIDFLKVASQRAYNPDELEKLFYAGVEFHAIVEDSIKDAFIRVGGDDPVNQKLLEDLFERTELGDYMREVLPKAKTPADLELIRDEFHGKWQDAIDTMMRGSLEAKISDITNSEEGVIGLLSTMSELGIYQYQTQYDMSLKWGEAHARMDSVTDPNLKSQIYNATRALQQRVWDRTWAYLANSYDAIIKKAGVGEYADRFTILVKQEADAAKNYFDNLQKINDDYYDKPKSNESDAAKDAAIADLTKVWRDSVKGMNEQRQKLWIEMLAENVKTVNGLEGDALVRSAQEFSDKHLKRLNKLRDAVDKHYDTIKTKNRSVRRTMSEEFFTKKYQPLVAEIRNEFIKDSYKKFFKVGNEPPGTAEPANVVKDIPTNPLDDIIEETTAVTSRNEMSVEAKKQHLITINKAEGIMAKQNVIEGLKLTNATDEQINSYVPILEAAADMYHEITGNDANEWYSKEFDSFEFIDADAIANGEGAASIRFKEDGRAVIQFCRASNLTSAAHEIKHIFLKQLGDYYRAGQSNDFEVVAKELGGISGQEFLTIVDSVIKGDYTPEQWKQWDDISEKFVDGLTKFELDDSPSLLRGAFVKFSRFIAKLFEEAGKYFNDIISPEMYEVYTRLYSKNDSAQRIARNKGRINESPTGIKVVVKDSDMHPYELIPVIVDMDWITKSHTLTGSETPGYNKSLQPREYKLDNVEKYARELNPDAVIDKAVTFSNGMPVINEDGMVIVGNHRMGALERARVSYPDNWKAYQDYLVKSLEQYGFDADDLKGIENPVLVYKPADPNQVDVIVNAANISDQQMMTDFANANKFAKFIKPESMAKLEVQEGQSFKDAIYSKSGDGIRTDFASNIASSESAAYIDAKGNLTENGLQTIMNAIASKAFGDKPEGKLLLVNAIESKNTVAQNVMTAMVEAVPGIAKLNALIEQGVLPEGYAISETLAKAVNEYIAFKNQPKGDAIAQTDLFNVRTPLTIDLMTFFDNFGKSKKVIGELITRYIDSAIKQGSVNPEQLNLLDDGAKNVLPADELMKSMLDLVNGKATKELEAVKDARHVAVIKDITTKPIDKWDANVRASVEQQLQAFQAEIKVSRTEPPAWMNVKDLYEGTSKSYSEVRKAIKNILDGKTPTTQKELAVLRQAFNRAIAESKAFEKYVGAQNTDYGLNAKMDKLLQDISEVTQMSFIPGQERVMEVVKELENIKPEVDKYDPTNPIRVKFKEGWRIAQQQALPLSDFEVEQMVVAEKLAKVKNTPQQGTLFQDISEVEADDLWYFSAAEKAVTDRMPNKATVDQVRALFKDGVKKAELDWLDIDSFLEGKTMVEKQELLDYIGMHNVHVVDNLFGDPANARTYYSGYIVEGGTNYRELLLTLDDPDINVTPSHFSNTRKKNILGHVRYDDRITIDGNKTLFLAELQSDWAQHQAKWGYSGMAVKDPQLVKIDDGLYEIRNKFWDRDKYSNQIVAENTITIQETSPGEWTAGVIYGNKPIQRYNSPQEAYSDFVNESIIRQKETTIVHSVPRTPFPDFHMLLFKRMLRFAVDNNYKEMTFPTGALAAEIEAHSIITDVETLKYNDVNNNLYVIQRNGGRKFVELKEGRKLKDYVGDDIAKAVMETETDSSGYKIFSPPKDFVFGGEKMRWFYDELIVNDFNKYLKKWGIKIEAGEIRTDKASYFTQILPDLEAIKNQTPNDVIVYTPDGKEWGILEGFHERVISDMLADGWVFKGTDYNSRPTHKIVLNDKLIDSVKEGQPLFQPITEVPVGGDQITRQDWSGWNELANHKLEPLFNQIMDNYVGLLGEPQMKLKFDNLDDAGKAAMRAQYERWKTDIQLRTAAAVDYGKAMTDHTLLDYTQKRGVDNLLQAVFPFQFWYTQSISEWGKHMISTPVIGATYSKYKEMMRRNKLSGLPSRLAGKSPLYAPWLPDELGDTLWVNPMSKFFPLESLTQPVANLSDLSYEITNNAIRKVNDMVRRGLITKEQALQAIDDKDGVIWQNAVSTARLESGDKLDPMSMVSMMMQPAPWYTMPYYMIQGTPEKNYPYPPTRLGLALAAQSDGLLGAFGKMIAYPETKIREIAGLSPHGEFGDYYIEFMLANMATGDKYDTDTIIRAMLEKEGEAYEEAKQLADEYLSYRMPGSALIQAVKYAKETGEYGYIAPAFLATMFPAGLFPKGELEQRGLAKQYSEAWDKFVLGDTEAMQTFFDENPEYEARLALFKDEPERLHSHLINILWDSYMKLSSPDKKLVNDQLGQSFKTYFLDTNTRDYSRLDNDMLAYWGRQLNAKVPATPETESALNRTMNPLEMYKPDIAAAAQDFMNMRNEMFPNFYWLQNLYFEIPESDRQKFLKGFPELKEYWDWKDSYTEANPLVADYLEDQKSRYTGSDATQFEEPNMKLFAEWDAELALAVGLYMISGQSLSTGAKAELTRIWDGLGRPGGSFDVWLKAYLGL